MTSNAGGGHMENKINLRRSNLSFEEGMRGHWHMERKSEEIKSGFKFRLHRVISTE